MSDLTQGRGGAKHYVNRDAFDPHSVVKLTPEQERYYLASQWRLMWWKLKRRKLAVVSGIFLLAVYGSILISEFLAPYALEARDRKFVYAPPQALHLFHEGEFIGPFVYGFKRSRDPVTLQRLYEPDTSKVQPLRFFCSGGYRGAEYMLWGTFRLKFHLFCPAKGDTAFLFGTDRLGRDLQSRIICGARISLTVGLVGVIISFVLGIVIGGIAGYYGGIVDSIIQRIIEVIRSFPALPLWMALSAVLPVTWSPVLVYIGITVILGLLDWPGLARAVRSKLLALREEDFCVAAQLMGAKPSRIIGRHLMPSFMSHLIASATLSIPSMILGETALSFLGLGLRPPITSWGVLMNEAQNFNVVALCPWLMLPALPVLLVVLAFQFLGDGLRDAADPYK